MPAQPMTAEEIELFRIWEERPEAARRLADVNEFADWLVLHRPELLPKGRDDASIYLARLLHDSISIDPAR